MEKLELLQKIGDLVCEGCGPCADCGIKPEECSRIIEARKLLEEYAQQLIPTAN